ncbi:MAG: hypothetical protein IJO03_08960 [Clostridia bacterium]|nr:hypothetical protein [Clostridia bacterium]MBQ7122374.1 hypothetical protein [Clostridia bacterium]
MAKIRFGLSFIVMMFSILFNTIDAALLTKAPEPLTEQALVEMQERFDEYELAEEITVVKASALTLAQRQAVIALQGLVARDKPQIFIDYGYEANRYALNEMQSKGHKLVYNDESGKPWKFSTIVAKFKPYIADGGYTLFATEEDHGQLNTAVNLTTLNGWLPITPADEETVIQLGLEKKADISGDNIDVRYLKEFYNENKDKFRNDSLVHMYYYAYGMRDFAVQQNIFVMYVDDSDYEGRVFRDSVMKDLKPSSTIFGWCQYEIKFTESASRYGHHVIPSDHSFNLSILSSFDATEEKFAAPCEGRVELDPDKHYVAVVYSDGDNLQWIQNGFSEFHTWQSYNSDIPVSWTFAPIAAEVSDIDVKRTLANSKNATFITGPSGGGYARIMNMNSKELEAFSDQTASVMLESGLEIMTLLDEIKYGNFDSSMQKRLGYFSRYDNIKGGILQLDPNNYAGGGGRVYFSDDKPFVTVGFSLWHPSENADEVTNEWLAEQAAIINAKPADIKTINGYTVINIHPWTVGPDDLAYFLSRLDDSVEVVPVDELLAAIEQNIPHEFAQPE